MLDLDDWVLDRDALWWTPAGYIAGSDVPFWDEDPARQALPSGLHPPLWWTDAGLRLQ